MLFRSKGFMVGRSLWATPARDWLRGGLADDAFIAAVAANFETLVDAWRASRPRIAASAPSTPVHDTAQPALRPA